MRLWKEEDESKGRGREGEENEVERVLMASGRGEERGGLKAVTVSEPEPEKEP